MFTGPDVDCGRGNRRKEVEAGELAAEVGVLRSCSVIVLRVGDFSLGLVTYVCDHLS